MTTARHPPTPVTTRKPRPRPLAIADTIVAVALSLFGLIVGYSVFLIADEFVEPVFGIVTKLLTIVAWVGGTVMFILFATRGRYAFYWPIVGIALIFGFFIAVTFIASRTTA